MPLPVAFILLAAGGSSRMGRPKQFLAYRGRSLLRNAAESALASPCGTVFVVVGAHAERARAELAGMRVRVVENANWEDGIGSSIRAGVAAVEELGDAAPGEAADAILVGLCDQPHVGSLVFTQLIDTYRAGGRGIVAAGYGGTAGVPALFGRKYFPDLRGLGGAAGAKKLLDRYADDVTCVPVPAAELDVDTPVDYLRLAAQDEVEDEPAPSSE